VENPSEAEINELLLLLQARIKECFDKHKASYGWENVQLTIK
jgi:hypothetical protein